MKRATFFVSTLGALAVLAACAATGTQRVAATRERMDAMTRNLDMLKIRVDNDASSLSDLVNKTQPDPKAQFAKYSSDSRALRSAVGETESRYTNVRASADKLFAEWSMRADTIHDADVKKVSEQRRNELSKAIDGFVAAAQPALEQLKSYVETSRDIEAYLSNDLTPSGIRALSDKSKAQTSAAAAINRKLDDVAAAAQKASTEFATIGPAP
jgi:DNA primase large subunit